MDKNIFYMCTLLCYLKHAKQEVNLTKSQCMCSRCTSPYAHVIEKAYFVLVLHTFCNCIFCSDFGNKV